MKKLKLDIYSKYYLIHSGPIFIVLAKQWTYKNIG